MTEILQKNLEALEKSCPGLRERIEKHSTPKDAVSEVKAFRKNSPSMELESSGDLVFKNYKTHPRSRAETLIEGMDNTKDVVVFFGLGLGYHLEVIKERYPDKKIILLELDDKN